MKQLIPLFSFLSISLLSCSEDPELQRSRETIEVEVPTVSNDVESVKTYNLPAPTEVAQIIHSNGSVYMKELMVPLDIQSTTTQNKALILGMYGVDIGYSLSYEQPQEALNYLEKVVRLGDDLKIMSDVNPQIIERFKKNMNNIDSTTVILMGAFSVFQNYLKKNQEEKTGIYIFTGSFIEGLHLALQHHKKNPGQEMMNLIGQQKLFLENLLAHLEKYDPSGSVAAEMKNLSEIFNQLPIEYTVNEEGKKIFKDIQIPYNLLKDLSVQVTDIRTRFLQTPG